MVKITSSVEEQVPLVAVHLKITLVPKFNPVTVDVGLLGVVTTEPFAAPITVQAPVPTEGVVAAKVKLPILQRD